MADVTDKLAGCDFPVVRSWLKLPEDAAGLMDACVSASDALDRLEWAGFLIEAAQLVAHALPKRESVWWACMCADYTAPADLPAADWEARDAAENWVRFHTDLLRRNAMDYAEAAGFRSPEAWAAVAAFWSGESLAPPGKPVVKPAPQLTGTAVFAAIRLAAVRDDPGETAARLHDFLGGAREIAKGGIGRLTEDPSESTIRRLHP